MHDRPYTTDTSPEAHSLQRDLLRQMTPVQRIRQTMVMSDHVRRMAFEAIQRRHPEFDENQRRLRFIELVYGKSLADSLRRWQEEQTLGFDE